MQQELTNAIKSLADLYYARKYSHYFSKYQEADLVNMAYEIAEMMLVQNVRTRSKVIRAQVRQFGAMNRATNEVNELNAMFDLAEKMSINLARQAGFIKAAR